METNKRIIDNAMSTELIEQYTDNKARILTMQEISKMKSLKDVFQNQSYVIIFTATNSPNDGHFQMIWISGGVLNWFDSYALQPTGLLDKMMKLNMNLWGQNNNLWKLIQESQFYPNSFRMNTHKYQSNSKNVATCGRYCTLNVLLKYIYEQKGKVYNTECFFKLMQFWKTKYKKNYDSIVSSLIDEFAK